MESFRNQLYAEALRRGMSPCETVLVLTDGAVWLIADLKELGIRLEEFSAKQIEAIQKETAYLEKNKNRMDCKTGSESGQPVGPGAIESTCSQYQRRFKMTGQFWSLEGDKAFLALSTLQRNGRWGKLFPGSHVSRSRHSLVFGVLCVAKTGFAVH